MMPVIPSTVSFTPHEIAVLTLICDTLAPSLSVTPDPGGLYSRSASDLDVVSMVMQGLLETVSASELAQIKQSLWLLEQPIANGLLANNSRAFLDMPLDERTHVLYTWATSSVLPLRKGFQTFKRLALFCFYTIRPDDQPNPNWVGLGYQNRPPCPPIPETVIDPLTTEQDCTLHTDVVIVGSGAGGGVVAGELSAAGLDVIVVEKGQYYRESAYHDHEMTATAEMFERRGLLTSRDLGITILAGSVLGGGTTINWCASFRTPEYILHEWERLYHLPEFSGSAYQQALDSVSARLNVNSEESLPNPQNAVLERGAQRLGYSTGVIPRNTRHCSADNCGYCNFGCTIGAKQSTLKTYLQDAYERGSRLLVNTRVDRILHAYGRAVGIQATTLNPQGSPVQVTIHARVVVIAGGAIQTPALLLRSGLTNANIGRNLHLHPTSLSYGVYEEPIRGWQGQIMTRVCSEFRHMQNGYGVSLQTAPVHPGIAALVLPWRDGFQHKRTMQQLDHLGNIIVITRDQGSGRITLDSRGEPVVDYRLSPFDAEHLRRGVLASMRIHQAAGALEIGGPHTTPMVYHIDDKQADFEAFLRTVDRSPWTANQIALLSAHQMSSARIGSNSAQGALTPHGECYEVRNLYVADGSALPTSLGINPMLTIMAVAYTIAQHIKACLQA